MVRGTRNADVIAVNVSSKYSNITILVMIMRLRSATNVQVSKNIYEERDVKRYRRFLVSQHGDI